MRTISIIFVILFSGAYLHSADSSYIRPFKPAASDELIFNRMELIELNNGIRLTDFEYLIGDGSILTVSVEVVKDGLVVKDKSMSFTIGSKRSRFSKKGLGIFRVQGRTDQGKYLHHYHFDMDQGASYGVAFDAFVAQKADYEISNCSSQKKA